MKHPQFALPPYYCAKEHATWTTILYEKNGRRGVARVVWLDGPMLAPVKSDTFPVVLTYYEEPSYTRREEIPFDTPEAAVKYVETMCALGVWEN
jgi:hypothetical protein